MEDRRKIKRRYLLYYVRVYDALSREQIGNLVDITQNGAMILSNSPIPDQQVFDIRIELSNEVSEKQFMDLTVRTIWCHPDIDPHLFNIGFKIEKISPAEYKIVQKIVDTYGFRDNKLS